MRAYSFRHLADKPLLGALSKAVFQERASTAEVVALIAEVDERRLYLAEGYASMHAYCVGELRMSEGEALKRIQAARLGRQYPEVFAALADGRLHLTAVNKVAPHVAREGTDELIRLAMGKTKTEIEKLIASRYPTTEPLAMVQALPGANASATVPAGTVVKGSSSEHTPAYVHSAFFTKLAPIALDRYALQFSFGQAAHDKLRKAQQLLSHAVPAGDLEQIFERALDALITGLEKRRFAATEKPRSSQRRSSSNARTIPAHVRRAVWERDGGRCTFVGESGHRCDSTNRVQFDHIVPVARGGLSTIDNLRLRCKAHNQLEAERVFGAGFMEEKREEARRARVRFQRVGT